MAKKTPREKQAKAKEERHEWIRKQKAKGLTNSDMWPTYSKLFGREKIQSLHDDIHLMNKEGGLTAGRTKPKTKRSRVAGSIDTSSTNSLDVNNLELGEVVKDLPLPGWSTGPHVKYPKQFKKIQGMEVEDALIFPTTKEYMAMINAIRTYLKKTEMKIYDVRRVDDKNSGIWRRPAKVAKIRSKEKGKNTIQNDRLPDTDKPGEFM